MAFWQVALFAYFFIGFCSMIYYLFDMSDIKSREKYIVALIALLFAPVFWTLRLIIGAAFKL